MQEYRIEVVVPPDKTLTLENLPFEVGATIEVTILEKRVERNEDYPLRGTLLKYDNPFEPAVPLEDWEALK